MYAAGDSARNKKARPYHGYESERCFVSRKNEAAPSIWGVGCILILELSPKGVFFFPLSKTVIRLCVRDYASLKNNGLKYRLCGAPGHPGGRR